MYPECFWSNEQQFQNLQDKGYHQDLKNKQIFNLNDHYLIRKKWLLNITQIQKLNVENVTI